MALLTLPARTPGTVRAFWLTASAGIGVTAATGLAITRRDPKLLATAAPIAAVVAAGGLARPEAVEFPYRAWNRLGRHAATFANAWLTRVAAEVVATTRVVGEQPVVPRRTTGTSGWVPRSSQPAAAFRYQDATPRGVPEEDALNRFARQDGNQWVAAMVPLVRLVAMIETDDATDDAPPTDIYTLF